MHKLATDEPLSLLIDRLADRIQTARSVVYEADNATRCDILKLGTATIVAKREDTSKIHSYKWRGSFVKMNSAASDGHSG